MADPSIYNYAEIQRYLQQGMSPSEMHAFEKAMLEDPFLADAMEGYTSASTTNATNDLSSIQNEILGNKEQTKVIAINKRRRSLWQVAAILLLVIGAGLITYQLNQSSTNSAAPQVALQKEKTVIAPTDRIGPVEQELATTEAASEDLIAQNSNSQSIIKPAPTSVQKLNPTVIKDTALIVLEEKPSTALAQPEVAAASPASTEVMSNAIQSRKYISAPAHQFIGKVVDHAGEPIPFASVRAQGSNAGTITDAKGNFTIVVPDTTVTIDVQSVGYTAAKAKLATSPAANNITMLEEKASLSEVVVTGMNARKKQAVSKQGITTAEPIGGWPKFNEYFNAELDSLRTRNFYNNNVDVTLEFNIDEEGKPVDINFSKNAANDLKAKAIELLQNGPKWKQAKKNEKVKVKISF